MITWSQRRTRVVSVAGAVLVLAAISIGVVATRGPDRGDPAAVAEAWSDAYATGGGDACALATPDFARELQAQGRCNADQDAPVPDVVFAKPCMTRALAGIAWHGDALGAPYALLGMAHTDEGKWAVDSVTPLSDRQAVRPGQCDTEED